MGDAQTSRHFDTPAVRAAIALGVTAAASALLMWVAGPAAYNWIKALHVMAIISWMAGMLYLPRLFVYHCAAPVGSVQSETFKVMEQRLLTIIINPAMIAAWVFGLWLAWSGSWLSSGWFHGKLLLVLLLSGLHGYLSAATRAFAEDRNAKQPRFWRILNEVPAVLMAGIVVLVVIKPF